MSNIYLHIRRIGLLFLCFAAVIYLGACASKESGSQTGISALETDSLPPEKPLRDPTPEVLLPEATGMTVLENDIVTVDISNISDGYICLTYLGSNEKVKFRIEAPNEIIYTYLVSAYGEPMVFPLTGGNGSYLFSLYESVDAKKDLYAVAFSQEAEVAVTREFLPYLTPNVYANFGPASACVELGAELASDCYTDLDVINNIYLYVTQNITYDKEKAQHVSYGYIPSPDETLECGKGICFDYASLMTSMLRSQRIPTRLEVGYVGEVYHAWISCYVSEIGWVDNIIQFDGEHWSLMDPTLAASNSSSAVQEYIGDGSGYLVKYTY